MPKGTFSKPNTRHGGYDGRTEESMTRQKKEIMKKINEIEIFIAADDELGCGFAPAGFYDPLYEQIYELQEKLAHLSHYKSVEEMLHDTRGCGGVDTLPFV